MRLAGSVPCKIGTVPKCVRVYGNDTPEVGKFVRIQEEEGGRWSRVLVTQVDEFGYFMADR